MMYGASTCVPAKVASDTMSSPRRVPVVGSRWMSLSPLQKLPSASQASPCMSMMALGSMALKLSLLVEQITGAPSSTQLGASRLSVVAWPMHELLEPKDDAA